MTAPSRLASALAAAAVLTCTSAPRADEPVETALLEDRTAPARLVLAHWPKDGWVVRQKGSLAEILFQDVALDIDLSAVANGALGGTVTGVQAVRGPESTLLRLELGCDCRLALHGDGEARLAIDIVGADLPAGPMLAARGPLPGQAPTPPVRKASALKAAGSRHQEPDIQTAGSTPGDGTRLSTDTLDVDAARARLLDQLERAAEAGLIVLDGPPRSPAETETPLAQNKARHRQSGSRAAAARLARERSSPAAKPAPERSGPPPKIEETASAPPPPAGPKCLAAAALALPEPLPPEAIAARIAQYRRALIGEFDQPNVAAAFALARLYIANGLGAEARMILREFADGAAETPVLAAISHIVDNSPLPDGHALAGPACGGVHGLWQAAAASRDRPVRTAAKAIEFSAAALQEIPLNLRSQIAVEFGLAAAAAQDWQAARKYQAIAERDRTAGVMKSAAHILLDSTLARHYGQADKALAALQTLWAQDWDTGSRDGQEALIRLANLSEFSGQRAGSDSHNLRLDLSVLALQQRGTGTGERAHLAEVRLAAQAFGRDEALDLLSDGHDAGLVSDGAYARALAELAGREPAPEMTGAEELPLALLYERDPDRYAKALTEPGFRTALARSYANTGAPELGVEILRHGDMADPHIAATFAKAFLAAGAVTEAAAAAQSLPEGPRRAALSAEILLAQGNAQAAFAEAQQAGEALDPGLAARIAWTVGEWGVAAAALKRQIAAAPEAETAARFALASARAGAPDPALDSSGPNPLAQQRPFDFAPSAEGVARFLSGLDAEAKAIKEVLDDG